jgi:4-hydroxy-2-oxoheptanedioate aldolase
VAAAAKPLNRLRTLLREKKPAFGAIATMPSVQAVQVIASSGLDWVIVDLEHGAIDMSAAHAMIVATAGTACVPLARIADNQAHLAKVPMDLGAFGINFPMICSADDAARAVKSVRYPPDGERMWGPFYAPLRWGMTMPDYMAAANDEMICMITIEHAKAVEHIDEIMAVPGIDVAIIGVGDLATSIGKPGRLDDPELLALVKRAEDGILNSGVPMGAAARSAEQANAMIDRGYLVLGLGFDWSLFQRGIDVAFDGIRR